LKYEKLWQSDNLVLHATSAPIKPELVSPDKLPKRGIGTQQGRVILMHAIAHIEFNAINLAWDAIYRFRHLPIEYYSDWIHVAKEEVQRFSMIRDYRLTTR